MRPRIVLIISAVILAIGIAFLLWKFAHPPKKKVVIQKRIVAREAVKKGLPAVQKKFANPKVAIVMDDFGYNMNNLDELFAMKGRVTFSVLPNLPYSRRISQLARSKGYEVILHLPLEANDSAVSAESDTIKTSMSEKEITSMLEKEMGSVPGLSGVSNHQGSKATEYKATMTSVLADLKERNLYFFDSLVTEKSVCRDVAHSLNVPYLKRDMFLDNTNSPDYIEKQILALRRFAFRKGRAIAVCHDRKKTIDVLSKMMPELSAEGIEFVSLSDMVK